MFSFTEALHNGESNRPQAPSLPDSPPPVETPHRHSNCSPEYSPDPQKEEPSSPYSTVSTRVPSPGLECVRSDDETLKELTTPYIDSAEKEFSPPPPKGDYHSNGDDPSKRDHPPKEDHPSDHTQSSQEHRKRRKRPYIIAAVVLVVVLAIALGVGLGVGLKKQKGSSKPSGSYKGLSTVGAFNGSGLALASQSFDAGGFGSIVMYFQHHSGQLRSAQLDNDGNWKGGDETEVVAVDAKNGTPIAAVAFARNETAAWHIFYINNQGTISEVINSNRTNVWAPGPLNKLALKPMDDRNVGLQACWYGSFYSDVAYNHSPVPGQSPGPVSNSDQTIGIHLWYGSNPTTFNSVAWIYGDTVWTEQQEFKDYNAHAGVGCYSWGPGSETYVVFVDLSDNVNILWKDLNVSHKATPEHPVHEWAKTNVSIPVYPNSSLGFTNYLYVQNPDLTFSGVNITWDAENTSAPLDDPEQHFVINGGTGGVGDFKGMPGTHLSVTALPDKSGGDSLLAFYQTNGSDVTEFVRDFEAGQWTSGAVPIPDE